ncbi:hypothetical protein [Candidatus Thiodiazotropha sp. CDECU1]|uniref:hypothetical protein n=1 Tax=Candidatus Thiodiazotropha sp. CDECU1 TaxID=3065865 RepID=UPI00292EBEB1|nr:hypothetical protein [Candidatus Thiodiazotropha sp. CDECU1]
MNARKFAFFSIYFGIAVGVAAFFLFLLKTTPIDIDESISPEIFASYGSLVGGVVGPFFALAGVLLLLTSLIESKQAFIKQQIENRFFQLMSLSKNLISENRFPYDQFLTKLFHCFTD